VARWVSERAPPVADAAREAKGSGRKNRGKRKPEDFFGHRNLARRDNPEVEGSSPSPATTAKKSERKSVPIFLL